MDFSDALRVMKQGHRVRRAVWPVPSSVQAYTSLEIARPGDCEPCFVCTYDDGTRAVMHVSAYHMLECDDWEPV